ncbi:hypothetical protein [Ottowia testudinis]|uniref:Porin n=1 Tax=Ottowia testudinis TaxID=2816950 RepID=A0A975CIA0_9BURK|nr:hypothetical protein [Ottowia testudinis]QTD43903.1 hypothetical protein J1M35_12185 [Ottowia testudinis]
MKRTPHVRASAALLAAAAALTPALGQAQAAPDAPDAPVSAASVPAASGFAPTVGAVLDLGYASQALALGERDKGPHLGGAELTVESPLGPWLHGRLTAAAHSHDNKIEKHFEEVWLGTTALPAGLQLRGGRFLSQVGYLNEQHPHADDFSTRPLLYRSFLGGHYFDNGLRLNWTAPTDFYWRTGLEVFSGKQLTREAEGAPRAGVFTLSTKFGGDVGREHSWQLGLSYLGNRRAAQAHHDDEDAGMPGHGHSHEGHAHGAQLAGKHLWLVDGVWKWAPGGNNRAQQLRLAFEFARQSGLGEHAARGAASTAGYLAAVYRFHPEWEAGVRTDWLRAQLPHGDHFHAARLREYSLMLAWKPSHQQTLRLQYSQQTGAKGFDNAGKAITLQYIISLGAHGAHSF